MADLKAGKRKKFILAGAMILSLILSAAVGCGGKENAEAENPETETADAGGENALSIEQPAAGIANETAVDAEVDFEALCTENSDIFAWIYIPGTDIDAPVLQSEEADDYYESHDAYGKENEEGALYTELANLKNMCDFNTVIHGKASADGQSGLFHDLYRFADPDFFAEHENVYLYIDGNLLTYKIFAAYERENTSLIRTYDFTYMAGCQQFLDDLYGTRSMGMNLREGWEDVGPYHFLITLTAVKDGNPDKQFVAVAALVGDAAGTIDRLVVE